MSDDNQQNSGDGFPFSPVAVVLGIIVISAVGWWFFTAERLTPEAQRIENSLGVPYE